MDDIKTYFNWSPNEWHTEGRKNVADILNKLDDNYETKAKGEDYSHKADLCRSLWLAIQNTDAASWKEITDENEEKFNELRRFYTYTWLILCVNTKDDNISFYFSRRNIDREEAVYQILYENGKIGSFFRLNGEIDDFGRQHLEELSFWFIRRYDLKTASQIIDELCQVDGLNLFSWIKIKLLKLIQKENKEIRFKTIWQKITSHKRVRNLSKECLKEQCCFLHELSNLFCWIKIHLFWPLALILFGFVLLIFVANIDQFPLSIPTPKNRISFNQNDLVQKYLIRTEHFFQIPLCIIYVVIIAKVVETFITPMKAKLFVPRLLSSIFLGYLVPVIGDEVWKFAIALENSIRLTVVSSALITSLIYLRTEVGNAISKEVWKRSLKIWCRGILYAHGMGLILMDFLCGRFLKNMDYYAELNPQLYQGIFGVIEWKAWFFFSAVALLIGIFLQIIWEDKPITEPL